MQVKIMVHFFSTSLGSVFLFFQFSCSLLYHSFPSVVVFKEQLSKKIASRANSLANSESAKSDGILVGCNGRKNMITCRHHLLLQGRRSYSPKCFSSNRGNFWYPATQHALDSSSANFCFKNSSIITLVEELQKQKMKNSQVRIYTSSVLWWSMFFILLKSQWISGNQWRYSTRCISVHPIILILVRD